MGIFLLGYAVYAAYCSKRFPVMQGAIVNTAAGLLFSQEKQQKIFESFGRLRRRGVTGG